MIINVQTEEGTLNFDVSKMTKVVAGKKLWNYDALEPTEKKGAI